MNKSSLLIILVILASVMILVWSGRGLLFPQESGTSEVVEESEAVEVAEEKVEEETKNMNVKFLKTTDGVDIAYDLYEVLNANKWFVLVHMMPATKESWSDFAKQAQQAGVASIAIDLRGHGQSAGGPDDYKNFTDTDHQKSILDVKAAADYLIKKGVKPEAITFIGASIGANLVLQFIVENPQFKRAALLSPGLNYKGIETLPLVQKLSPGQGVWFIAAEDDERSGGNAGAMAKQLYEAAPGETVERRGTVFKQGGHGTEILTAVPQLAEKLFAF